LVVLTADHGELFFDRGMVTHGRTLYDVEARVPIALRWPGRVPVERRDEPVSHLDIMPTVLALLGLSPHPSWQGRSFLVPQPETAQKRAIFLNIQGLRFADAIVCWPYKLMIDRTSKTYTSWEQWYREVIWYGNKKGAYLYGSEAVGRQLAGHH
jgi:predicted AlkP superfamily pyrophosphatase or phosphodiesterase